jgi:hypothetical protein
MIRRPGVVLAVSFAVMIVLILVMLTTNQENQGWGPLRIAILVVAALSVGYSVWFGLYQSRRARRNRRTPKR